jgi:hypothetical protein
VSVRNTTIYGLTFHMTVVFVGLVVHVLLDCLLDTETNTHGVTVTCSGFFQPTSRCQNNQSAPVSALLKLLCGAGNFGKIWSA